MRLKEKVGFIGVGNMGSALVKGLVEAKTIDSDGIGVFDVVSAKAKELTEKFGVRPFNTISELIGFSDIILIAVKPQNITEVLDELRGALKSDQLIISIAAGISIEFIEERLGSKVPIVRVMPNTPALIGEGASALSRNDRVDDATMEKALTLFRSVGIAVEVDEKLMDAITGLSGSGPAYVMLFLEALTDAGVFVGLPRDVARTLVLQTILGSVRMVLETENHFAQLKDMVTSPGGTTIYGLKALEEAGFRSAVIEAVKRATDRSNELQKIASIGKK